MKTKRYYLANHTGSQGMIYDFSKAEIVEEEKLFSDIYDFMDASKAEFKYNYFDERINLHSWSLLAPYKKNGGNAHPSHYCWIYSTSDEHPYLTEYSDPYEK